jgi:glycosyltransferase involved in cell wall biosynthesis
MINFKIIIPVYNAEKWIYKCLNSLIVQNYKNWNAVVIDDCSNDNTLEIIKKTIKESGVLSNFKVLKRNFNVGALENIFYGISKICDDEEDVIVLLDGDDWFYDESVLSYLNDVYTNENIWMSYGSFISESGAHNNFCKQISKVENYRKGSWVTSHLRTFKYWLWKKIDEKDLKNETGKFYSMAWDMAIMYPLIEMSGIEKIKFIKKILYVYNDTNPINDFRKNMMNQIVIANEIKSKKLYLKLEKK